MEPGATILNSIIMPRAKVSANAKVEYAIVMPETIVPRDTHVGHLPVPDEEDQEDGGITVFSGKEK